MGEHLFSDFKIFLNKGTFILFAVILRTYNTFRVFTKNIFKLILTLGKINYKNDKILSYNIFL